MFISSTKVFISTSRKRVRVQHQKCLSPAQNELVSRYSDKPVCLQCNIVFGDESKDYLVTSDEHVRL